MTERFPVPPGKVNILRFKAVRPTFATLAVESTHPLWVLGLSMEGYDAYLRGFIKPPPDPQTALEILQAQPLNPFFGSPPPLPPPKGLLFSSPPVYTFATKVNQGNLVGWWYVLLGNRGDKPASAQYDVWE